MAKILVIEHITLDGVIQGPARHDEDTREGFNRGGWSEGDNDPLMREIPRERMGKSWSLLAGRRTYQHFAEVWPKMPQPNPFTEILNRVDKFVASRTLSEPLPWENSFLLKGDAEKSVAELKKAHDKTLVIFGSGVLVQSLMRERLVDEFVLQIHPLVLGTGRKLFVDVLETKFKLADSVTTSAGTILATYQLA